MYIQVSDFNIKISIVTLLHSSMKPHQRKLQLLAYDHAPVVPNPTNSLAQNSSSSISPSPPSLPPPPGSQPRTPPPPPQLNQQQQYPYANTRFDASMALTVLVLLTALSFMGFFSIYVRRFASDDSTAEYSPHRRRRTSGHHPTSRTARSGGARKGADPEVVKSLPVYSYYHGEAKYQIDCAICLGEFEEKEVVKMIPHCQHVFHLHCIDTWLKMHMTCPVCRGTHFMESKARGGAAASTGDGGEACERSTAENGETWIEIREAGPSSRVRRVSSCSSLVEGGLLQRTSSF